MIPTDRETSLAGTGIQFQVSGRDAAVVLLLLAASAVGCRWLDAEHPAGAALKTIPATLAVALVPGALGSLVWRPRPRLTLLEVLGFGVALSFGIVHIATMLAVIAGLGPVVVLPLLGVVTITLGVVALRKGAGTIVLTMDELIVATSIALLAVPLYLQGSPFDVYEDQLLVALVRRLSELPSPSLDNFFVSPGVVYTYPFPGALYFMALVARLGDIDPLFTYHKLRFFWGPAAVTMLYLAARSVFGYASVACAVAVTAVLLICTGVFAMVAEFPAWWGQLVPYSYVPDVAMTVLLPALLVMAFEYIQSASARERRFFLAAAALLVLMLTMVHIREIVQFAAYLGCFVLVAAIVGRFRKHLRPAAQLLAITIVLAIVYIAWHGRVVSAAVDMVDQERANLVAMARSIPLQSLIVSPASAVLGDYIQDFEQLFSGVIPFFLFAGTIVIVIFRDRPIVWLISSSTIAYLAVMTVPLLAIPYIYLTYFEILHIPVRNVIWFVYLLAGALLYVAAVGLARADRTRLSLVFAGALLGVLALLATLALNRSGGGFFAPLIAAHALTFAYLLDGTWPGGMKAAVYSRRIHVVGIAALLAVVALWPERSAVPRSDQVTIRWTTGLPDERRVALERAFSLGDGERKGDAAPDENAWNYRLSDLSVVNVREIVSSSDVVDTHFIDRTTFEVERQPPPGDHQPLGIIYGAWLQYPGSVLLAGTAVFIGVIGLVGPAMALGTTGWLSTAMATPFYRYAVPYALFVVPFVFWSARPSLSPLEVAPMPPAGRADTPGQLFGQIPCKTTPAMPARFAEEHVLLPERTTCPPDYALIEWVHSNLPQTSVFAVDRWTPYPPPVFMPQQAVVFPTLDASFIHEDTLFPEYYRFFEERMRRYRVQPFFNAVETPAERSEFVRALGVTHVLISPNHYDELRPVLDGLSDEYARRYDNARWAVYEVTPTSK